MTNTISRYTFESAIELVGYESIMTDYSGRGMMGEQCAAVVLSGAPESIGFALRRAAERIREDIEADEDDLDWTAELNEADALESMASALSWDNMGLDLVAYFPRWNLSD